MTFGPYLSIHLSMFLSIYLSIIFFHCVLIQIPPVSTPVATCLIPTTGERRPEYTVDGSPVSAVNFGEIVTLTCRENLPEEITVLRECIYDQETGTYKLGRDEPYMCPGKFNDFENKMNFVKILTTLGLKNRYIKPKGHNWMNTVIMNTITMSPNI